MTYPIMFVSDNARVVPTFLSLVSDKARLVPTSLSSWGIAHNPETKFVSGIYGRGNKVFGLMVKI